MSQPPISREQAAGLIKSGVPYRSCCGTEVTADHIPECQHFRAVKPPELLTKCSSCNMVGFHHGDCPERTVDAVSLPAHYIHPSGVELMDIERRMTMTAGNAFKYVMRFDKKGVPLQDLQKARWYLEDCIRYNDPLFINANYRTATLPLLETVVNYETGGRHIFVNAVIDLDVHVMAAATDGLIEQVVMGRV